MAPNEIRSSLSAALYDAIVKTGVLGHHCEYRDLHVKSREPFQEAIEEVLGAYPPSGIEGRLEVAELALRRISEYEHGSPMLAGLALTDMQAIPIGDYFQR